MFNKKTLDIFFERQLKNDLSFSPIYTNQIIRSFYNSEKLFRAEKRFKNQETVLANFSKDDRNLITANNDGVIKIWNLELEKPVKKSSKQIKASSFFLQALESNNDFSKIIAAYKNLFIIDVSTSQITKSFSFNGLFYDISTCPLDKNIFAFSIDKLNKIFILDERCDKLQSLKISDFDEYIYSIQYHPYKNNLLLLASKSNGVYTFDIRNCKPDFQYNSICHDQFNSIYASYNKAGDQIFVTRNEFNPVLYNSNLANPLYEFDEFGFYNFHGQSKGCFVGPNDEFVVASSDNFDIYFWEIPKKNSKLNNEDKSLTKKINSTKFILKGHRSIIQKFCYNNNRCILGSSGKDSRILFWSIFPFFKNFGEKFNSFSNEISHERILKFKTNLIIHPNFHSRMYDSSYENFENIAFYNSQIYKLISKQKINYKSIFVNSSNLFLKNFNIDDIDEILEKFEKDDRINYLKSIIMNYKIYGKKENLDLTNKINDAIENYVNVSKYSLHMRHLPLIFSIRKIHQTKYILIESIKLLTKQLIHLDSIKEKVLKNKKPGYRSTSYDLNKIKCSIEVTIEELENILNENNELYQKSTFYYKKFIYQLLDLRNKLLNDSLLTDDQFDSDLNLFIKYIERNGLLMKKK